MWLVICEQNDFPALWAAKGLEARGLKPLEIITPEALAYSRRLVHSLTSSQASVILELADGRVINSTTVCGTLNRLQLVPSNHLRCASEGDRRYAEQELYALFLSWLYCLQGVVLNKSTPNGLSGAWLHLSEWIWLASRAGLSPFPYCQSETLAAPLPQSSTITIIVVKGTCCGPAAPSPVREGCLRLAKMCGTDLLGVDFQQTPSGNWRFINASPVPDLRLGGEALLDLLSIALSS
jgi:hypothetical protein